MKFSQTQKLILALVILAIAGFIIYKSFFDGSSGGAMMSGGEATTTMGIEGNDIVNMVSEINTININPGLFSSPLFSGLVDFSVSLLPEPQGRSNPFADIGNDSGSVATSSAKATTK
jgi:hypothetical protein